MLLTSDRARSALLRLALRAGVRGTQRFPLRLRRSLLDAAAGLGPTRGVDISSAVVGGVPGRWVRPVGGGPGALLFLHGGAFITGSSHSHRRVAAHFAVRLRVPVFVPDYRRAPEHPAPAALDDALAAYEGLLSTGVAARSLLVAGDSAGGGLALALAQRLRDASRPLPAAVGLIAPWLDLRPDAAGSRPAVSGDPLRLDALLREAAPAYVAGRPSDDPEVSPLAGDLEGLPPMVVLSSSDDPLSIDADRLAARVAGLEHERVPGTWHGFHLHVGVLDAATDALDRFGVRLAAHLERRRLRVGIVGAGMSGLLMAFRLLQAGYDDVVIFEKGEEVGGTWRENRYPGLTCDVPSRFYTYSFAPNPDWTQLMASGPEILEYFRRFANDRDLRRRIRFGAEVTDAEWTGASWRLTIGDGGGAEVDILIAATGILHRPRYPNIEGLDEFAGVVRHSARWDPDIDLAGKRVGVIGTGSTGVQLTTGIAPTAEKLALFQRTPQWVLTVPNRPYRSATRWLYRAFPVLNGFAYRGYRWLMESTLGVAAIRPGWQRVVMQAFARRSLRRGVKDPVLRQKLTPDYEPLCKRIVVSGDFYETVQRDNVDLVTEGIERVEAGGVRTVDGRLHELDVLVLATGFDVAAFMRPMRIVGVDGMTLEDAWADGPSAYRTIALPGFPNLFTLVGPHSPVGNQSIIGVSETQTGYVLQWIDILAREGLGAVVPSSAATAAYNAERRAATPQLAAASGCASWYLGPDGAVEIWPWLPDDHRRMLRSPDRAEFDVVAQVREDAEGLPAAAVGSASPPLAY